MRPTLQRKLQPKILRKSRILISSKSLIVWSFDLLRPSALRILLRLKPSQSLPGLALVASKAGQHGHANLGFAVGNGKKTGFGVS
jgi:hypothetical protein